MLYGSLARAGASAGRFGRVLRLPSEARESPAGVLAAVAAGRVPAPGVVTGPLGQGPVPRCCPGVRG